MRSGKKILQAVTLFACVGEMCGRYKAVFSQAIRDKKALPDDLDILQDSDRFINGLSVSIFGEPGKAVCRLTFTSTGDLTVEEVVELIRMCPFTVGQIIDYRVENGALWLLLRTVPMGTISDYEAMLKAI